MDRTVTTWRLVLAGEDRRQRYGEPDGSAPAHPPIYAALIREWQSGGRTVPGVRDAQWTALVSPAPLIGESPPRRTAGAPDGG